MSTVHQEGQPEGQGIHAPHERITTEPSVEQGARPEAAPESENQGKTLVVKYGGPSGTFIVGSHTLVVGEETELPGEVYDSLTQNFSDHTFEVVRSKRAGKKKE